MRANWIRTGVAALLLGILAGAARAAPPEVQALPTCDYPQANAPFQTFTSSLNPLSRPGVAWNGREFGVTYTEAAVIYFRRYYADGTPAAPPVLVALSNISGAGLPVPLLWTGSGYALAWSHWQGVLVVKFAKLDENGALVAGPTTCSDGASWPFGLALASSGNGFAVTWQDNRNGNDDIFATLLEADGSVGGAGAYHDLALCTAANAQQYPSVAWSPGGFYLTVWQDYRVGGNADLYANKLTLSGAVGTDYALVTGASNSLNPRIASGGGPFLVAWEDTRDGNYEIYCVRLDTSGTKLGLDVRVTNGTDISRYPSPVFAGGEYGLFWGEAVNGANDLAFQRVSLSGTPLGSPLHLIEGGGAATPTGAFATKGYLAATCHQNGYPGYLQSVGCAYPSFPPCPENALAYNISGSQATLAWLPAMDAYFDVAYYQVFRNNSLVGTTSRNAFTDTGLSAGSTYNYSIRTVNAGQYVSTGCPASSSVYVKTNASLLLRVDKASPDAALTWTDSEPLNSYNVFRGTSPQVMQLVGTTPGSAFDDPNVLLDGLLYFYTVDDPGL